MVGKNKKIIQVKNVKELIRNKYNLLIILTVNEKLFGVSLSFV